MTAGGSKTGATRAIQHAREMARHLSRIIRELALTTRLRSEESSPLRRPLTPASPGELQPCVPRCSHPRRHSTLRVPHRRFQCNICVLRLPGVRQ